MDFQDLLYEVNARTSAPVPEFIKRYFNKPVIASNTTASDGTISDEVPTIPPTTAASYSFPEWFINFATTNRDGARGSWSISAKDENHSARGLLNECTQLAFRLSDAEYKAAKPDANIQAVGPVCLPKQRQLSRRAHHVVRIRAGGLFQTADTEVMHTRKDTGQFLPLFLQYERMTNQELGVSTMFSTDDEGQYIMLDESDAVSSRLYTDLDPIVTRPALVGPATVAYRARLSGSEAWTHAVKIKWPCTDDRPENEFLEIAMEKKAWGAAKVELYRELETTAQLRRGMGSGTQRRFFDDTAAEQGDKETQAATDDVSGVAQFTEETRRSFVSRTLTCLVTSPLGRALWAYQSRLELLEALRDDTIKCHKSLYLDVGLLHGDISHGNMIIVDDPGREGEGQPRGMLIDLELATPRDPAPERDVSITCGTRRYMAVSYMNDEARTYRQDLESFFYVFLWMVVGDEEMELPEGSRLRAWDQGNDWYQLAERKLSEMEQDNFQHIVSEFRPAFATLKGLAETLRALLFPVRDGKVWAGTDDTPEGTEGLYDGVIAAFDAAIASEK